MTVTNIKTALLTMPEKLEYCEKHGQFVSKNVLGKIWSQCAACTTESSIAEKNERESKLLQLNASRWRASLRSSGIPKRFADKTLESYVIEHDGHRGALEFARSYVRDFSDVRHRGTSFALSGGVGSGKNHIACAIANELIKKDQTVLFRTADMIIIELQAAARFTSDKSQVDVINNFVYPDLLIIDEIGIKSTATENELKLLFVVINERYAAGKPIILITNLSARRKIAEGVFKNEIEEFLGDRMYDRLKENGGRIIGFNWESYRSKAKIEGEQ